MGAQVDGWDETAADRAVAVLKAVADPTRYRLLWTLSQQELPVGSLAGMLGAHVAAVSQHLARLRAVGLVESRREGTRIIYRAAGPHVRGLLEEASLVAHAARSGPTAQGVPDAAGVGIPQEQPEPVARPVRTRRPAVEL